MSGPLACDGRAGCVCCHHGHGMQPPERTVNCLYRPPACVMDRQTNSGHFIESDASLIPAQS